MNTKIKETILKMLFVAVLIGGVNIGAGFVSAADSDQGAVEPAKGPIWEEWEEHWEEVFPW